MWSSKYITKAGPGNSKHSVIFLLKLCTAMQSILTFSPPFPFTFLGIVQGDWQRMETEARRPVYDALTPLQAQLRTHLEPISCQGGRWMPGCSQHWAECLLSGCRLPPWPEPEKVAASESVYVCMWPQYVPSVTVPLLHVVRPGRQVGRGMEPEGVSPRFGCHRQEKKECPGYGIGLWHFFWIWAGWSILGMTLPPQLSSVMVLSSIRGEGKCVFGGC